MRRLAVLLAVSLSAGLASAQDPASSEDRVPIPAGIETWYRIEQNKEHVGWYHESLTTTTMRNYRYEYRVESDYKYNVISADGEEIPQMVRELLQAQLEEDFDIYSMEYTQDYANFQLSIKLNTYSESDERVVKVDLNTDPPLSKEYKFQTSETPHFFLSPMLYRLRQTGSLAQPTRLREKVFVVGHDDPVSVSYSAGALTERDVLGKKVKVSEVRIEGWDRGALAPIAHLWVDKYGRIVEGESADKTMKVVMVKDQATAIGVQRGITQKGRRDPFLKSGAMDPVVKKDGGPTAPGTTQRRPFDAPKVEQDKYDAVLNETRALITRLQDEMAKGFSEEARSTYLKVLANYKGLYEVAKNDVVKRTEVEKVREDAENLYGGVAKLKTQIAGKVDLINDLYLNDNLEGIDRELNALKAMKDSPELFRSEDGMAELDGAIRASEAKRNQTVARIELGRKSLMLTGTITATEVVQDVVKFDLFVSGSRLALSQPVTVRRVVTMAVINDEPYKEGDLVAREGVKVVKIHRHAVEVEYKGEVRQVVLRK